MKDAGLGTPATRAATIERLIDAGYIEREGRSCAPPRRASGLIQMLGDHLLTKPELTGRWEQRLNRIERGEEPPRGLPRARSRASPARWSPGSPTRSARTCASSAASSPRAPPPAATATSSSTRRATAATRYSSKDEPGCGYTLWKQMAAARSPSRRPWSTSPPAARARTWSPSARPSGPAPRRAAAARSSSARAATGARAGRAAPSRAAATSSGRRSAAGRRRSTSRPRGGWWPPARPTPARGLGRAARRVPHPGLRRADRREQPRLRVHQLEEPEEPRLRLRHLEAREGPRRDPRGGQGAPGRGAGQPAGARPRAPAPAAGGGHHPRPDDRRRR